LHSQQLPAPTPMPAPVHAVTKLGFHLSAFKEHMISFISLQGDGSRTRQEIPQTAGWKDQGGFCSFISS